MRDFQTIQDQNYDVVVIGGGVNGAAVARDAALRGLKTILIEKNDFAGGTTSWSTRLVHGGLRYLEYFEFHLVRESLREREILLRTAPHLVHPIQMTIPIYRTGNRSYWEIQAGMLLYDVLSYDKTLPIHRMLPRTKFRQLFREVNPESLAGAAQYYDGQAEHAERLCLEILLSAQAAGAVALNYVKVTKLYRENDGISAIACEDILTGETFELGNISNAVVINTSGPWVDSVCKTGQQGEQTAPIGSKPKIGGTKGSHILVDPFPGAPEGALYVEAYTDGRPYFIVPWLGMYLIGTTDERYRGTLDNLKADDDEIDYLIAETNRVVPSAGLTRDDIRFTYSGVRPLPYAEGKSAGSISRSHILFDHTKEGVKNLVSLIGGKLTTHRQVGEEMIDIACRKLGRAVGQSPTREQPLPGAILPNDPQIAKTTAAYQNRVNRAAIHYLFKLYGARAVEVLGLVDESPDLAQPLVEGQPDIRAQAVFAIRNEMAHTLVDITRRRTTLAMHANYGFDALPAIVDTLKTHCGWTDEQCDRQLADYHTFMKENCIPDYALEQQESSVNDLSLAPTA